MKNLIHFALTTVLLCSAQSVFAAISFIASTLDEGNDDRSTLTVPAAVLTNDVLVTQVTFRNRSGSDGVTTPGGWTLVAPQDRDSDVFQSVYYRVATAGEAGNDYTWDFDGNGNRRYIVAMSVFRGVDTLDPLGAENSSSSGTSGGSLIAPSITPPNPNSMLVALYTLEEGELTLSTPAGMTEIYDEYQQSGGNENSGLTTMASYELYAPTTATGTRVSTPIPADNDDGIAHLLSLNEGASGPTITGLNSSCLSLNTLTVNFSEEVEITSAQSIANYDLQNAAGSSLIISNAVRSSTDVVTLTLANNLNDLTPYSLIVNNVEDVDGNAIANNSTENFMLSCDLNCITDDFVGPGPLSDSWSVGNSNGSFGDPRVEASGRLRLTDASGQVATFATLLNQFPGADNRVEIEFDYYAYGGNGADGIAVNFSDASIPPQAGASGGSLGYAQKTGVNGFAGGWVGIGIDEWGNFSAATEGRSGGGGSRIIDSVSIRGSGSGTSGYPFLTGTSSLSPGVDQSGSTPNPGDRYRIVIDHTAGGGVATISVERDTGSGFTAIIPTFNVFTANPSQAAVPENWVLSFTGSTGGSTNIHEIGDLKVCAAQPIQTYSTIDHYHISHGDTAATCEAAQVTITAHDENHALATVANDTDITITTTPAVEAIISSPVTMPACTDLGICTPEVSFYLNQTSELVNIDIDVTDGSITDIDGDDGVGGEDRNISFLDTVLRFYAEGADTTTTPIVTQIGGKGSNELPQSQSLELRALRTNTTTGACEAALDGPQDVDIAFSCINPSSCTASSLIFSANGNTSVAGTDNGDALSYSTSNMTFDSNGVAPFSFNYQDVGQIQMHGSISIAAASPEPAFTISGSSNEFVVRPFGFDFDFSGQRAGDWSDDSTLNGSSGNNSFATDENDSLFVAAGQGVNAEIRAVLWQGNDDDLIAANRDGQPTAGVDLTDNTVALNFGQESQNQQVLLSPSASAPAIPAAPGAVSPAAVNTQVSGTPQFSSGSYSLLEVGPNDNRFSWTEVGVLSLAMNLNNYLTSGANVSSSIDNVGRFYPTNFELQSNTVTNGCGIFSYMSHDDITINYSLLAKGVGGNTTQNYHGAFAKSEVDYVAENNNQGVNYSARLANFSAGASTPNWGSTNFGELTISDIGQLTRAAVPEGPYQNLNIGLQVDDNDGDVSELAGLDLNADNSDDCAVAGNCDAKLIAETDVRFGQLFLENAFGPETFPLQLNVSTRYFDGTRFIVNTDDSCTNLVDTDPPYTATSYSGNLAAGETSPTLDTNITNGLGVFEFSESGIGNEGSVVYEYAIDAWLRTESDGDGDYDDDPFSTITFGQFRGTDRIIYWREIIQ